MEIESIGPAYWRGTCRLTEKLSADWKLFVDWKTCCRSKNYLQIEEPFVDRRIVCRPNDYSIDSLKNNLQIKEVFGLKVEEISVDLRAVCR